MKIGMLGVGFLIAVMASMSACNAPVVPAQRVTGSRDLETRVFEIEGFTQVEVANAVQLEVARGDSFQVTIEADDNLWDYLSVDKTGTSLRIGMKVGYSFFRTTVKATVTMPMLLRANLSGASVGSITGFSSAEGFRSDVSGASTLKGDITAGDFALEVSGASTVTLIGSGRSLNLEVSGASRANLVDLVVQDADVETSGASSATVNVTGKLDASASGASSIRYTGDPTLGRQDVSGASSIRPR